MPAFCGALLPINTHQYSQPPFSASVISKTLNLQGIMRMGRHRESLPNVTALESLQSHTCSLCINILVWEENHIQVKRDSIIIKIVICFIQKGKILACKGTQYWLYFFFFFYPAQQIKAFCIHSSVPTSVMMTRNSP